MHDNVYDAVVVGTGAGGACAAYQLVNAGLRVLCVEKGPWIELDQIIEGGAFDSPMHPSSRGRGDELKYFRERFLQSNVKLEKRWLAYANPDQERQEGRPTKRGWMSQMVGGGTVHYGGASFRMDKADFEMKSRYGQLVDELEKKYYPDIDNFERAEIFDWPILSDEFSGWYDLAEKLVGIAGAPGSGLSPLRFSKAESKIKQALENVSSPIHVKPTPMAINSQNHMGRQPCHHSGLCQDYACRFEAKSDMRVTLLREAMKTGLLTIQPNSFVTRVNSNGSKTDSLTCIVGDPESSDAKVVELKADIFVVACEAMESCRLLLNSGIGNDFVGTNIMFHVTGGARSLSDEPTRSWENAPHTAYIDHFYLDREEKNNPFIKTGIFLVSSLGGPLQANWRRWGEPARRYLNDIYPYKMDLSYIGEALPKRNNKISLQMQDLDRYGMPGTLINYQPHPFDINAGNYASKKAKEILKLSGGTTIDDAPTELQKELEKKVSSDRLFHGSGGCRFGDDPATSVLDRDCKVHGMDNLYVTDGSFMPTGSGVNPTLTIQANALRVGQEIVSRFGH